MSIADKLRTISDNMKKIYDAGKAEGGSDDQWNAYCLKTPDSHFDLPVGMTTLSTELFSGCKFVKSVSMPDTITRIEYNAFGGSSIQSIKLSNALKTIVDGAFASSPIRIRQFPESLEYIDYDAFWACQNMDAIIFSPSIKTIGMYAFSNCKGLTSVTFVKTATKSGKPDEIGGFDDWDEEYVGPFENCPNLTTINVPWGPDDPINELAPWGADNATINYNYWDFENIHEVFHFPPGFEKIPDGLFGTSSDGTDDAGNGYIIYYPVKEIYLGEECNEIGAMSFAACRYLETVHLPEGLKTIGYSAFYDCSNLQTPTLPEGLEEIKNYAFENCTSFEGEFVFPRNMKYVGDYLFGDGNSIDNLDTIIFKGKPETICEHALYGCENISSIKVPWGPDDPINKFAPWGAPSKTLITYNWIEEE